MCRRGIQIRDDAIQFRDVLFGHLLRALWVSIGDRNRDDFAFSILRDTSSLCEFCAGILQTLVAVQFPQIEFADQIIFYRPTLKYPNKQIACSFQSEKLSSQPSYRSPCLACQRSEHVHSTGWTLVGWHQSRCGRIAIGDQESNQDGSRQSDSGDSSKKYSLIPYKRQSCD